MSRSGSVEIVHASSAFHAARLLSTIVTPALSRETLLDARLSSAAHAEAITAARYSITPLPDECAFTLAATVTMWPPTTRASYQEYAQRYSVLLRARQGAGRPVMPAPLQALHSCPISVSAATDPLGRDQLCYKRDRRLPSSVWWLSLFSPPARRCRIPICLALTNGDDRRTKRSRQRP